MPEPKFFEEGMLVWCKLRRYPYWPAVVRAAPASSYPADKEQFPLLERLLPFLEMLKTFQ